MLSRTRFVLLAFVLILLARVAMSQEQAVEGQLRLRPIGYATPVPPRAGHWWAMPVEVENRSDRAQQAEVVATVGDTTRAEYSTAISLAAGQTQRQDVWLKFPETASPGDSVTIGVTLRKRTDRGEIIVHQAGEPVVQEVTIPMSDQQIVTAWLPAPPPEKPYHWAWRPDARDHAEELAVAVRESVELSPSMVRFDTEPLPIDVWRWQAIDNVIVQDEHLLRDLAACAAMRQWLSAGGHAWIDLDLVDPEAIEPLLGDLWRCEVVGPVELSRYAVGTKLLPEYAVEPQPVARERPVRLVRLIQRGGEVTHSVDGWPAVIRVPVGEGEVWLSTLSADGWFRPQPAAAASTEGKRALETWVPAFISRFHQVPQGGAADPLQASPAAAMVGYAVPSRLAVFGSLLSFVLATGLAGAWLSRRGQLERIGWCVPLITLAASAPLFASASVRRRAVPDTIARVQYADVQPGAGQVSIEESGAVFLSRSSAIDMSFPAGTAYEPFPKVQSQVPYRLREQGSGALHLRVNSWPAGLRGLEGRFQHPVGHAAALGHFDAHRLVIEMPPSLPEGAADALLVAPPTRPWVLSRTGENRFELLAETSTEPAGIRSVDRLVSQDQRRHQEVYRELFAGERPERVLRKPAIFVWSRPWSSPIQTDHEFVLRGEALNRLHLRLVPPEPGSKIMIPSALLPVAPTRETVNDPTVQEIAAGGAHIPATQPKRWSMVFQLPPETLPLRIERARFSVRLQAPKRTVAIAGVDREREQSWGSFDSPAGTVTRTLDGEDVVYDPEQGTIVVQFDVSAAAADPEPAEEEDADAQPPAWQVQQPTLQVTGTVDQTNL